MLCIYYFLIKRKELLEQPNIYVRSTRATTTDIATDWNVHDIYVVLYLFASLGFRDVDVRTMIVMR